MTEIQNSKPQIFWSLGIVICDLPFDWAQGGEPVEPFVIWCLYFGILTVLVLGIFPIQGFNTI